MTLVATRSFRERVDAMKKPAFALLFVWVVAAFAAVAEAETGGKIIRLDAGLDEIVSPEAKAEQLATGFKSPEGPVWIRRGGYLLFSDLVENVIRKWNPADGKVSIFLDHSGFTGDDPSKVLDGKGRVGSNGITLDRQGRIVFCARGDRQVVRLEKDGKRTVLASRYDGKRFNSPNDLVYRSDGALYFTDPSPFKVYPAKEIPFNGIYLLKDGKLQLLKKDHEYPNGLAFTPDEKYLYVANTRQNTVVRYDVRPDGTLGDGHVFVDMSGAPGSGHPDGLKVDRKGNVYSRGPGGIWVLSSEGKHLGTIVPPEEVRNFAFGDADGKALYLATLTGLSRIRLKSAGILP
jgi:gluconolactonase